MNDVEVLERARELITPENRWCRGSKRREDMLVVEGGIFRRRKVRVTQYCAWGALQAVMGTQLDSAVERTGAAKFLGSVSYGGPLEFVNPYVTITAYNDGHSHKEVLAKFDEAIARAKAERSAKITVATHVTAAECDLAASGD